MTVDVCPACGYPTLGPDLCSYCRPVETQTSDRILEAMLSATGLHHGPVSVDL